MLTTPERELSIETPEQPARQAVVIGSGFGGLASAIRLSAKGYKVTLLEKQDGPYVIKVDLMMAA